MDLLLPFITVFTIHSSDKKQKNMRKNTIKIETKRFLKRQTKKGKKTWKNTWINIQKSIPKFIWGRQTKKEKIQKRLYQNISEEDKQKKKK